MPNERFYEEVNTIFESYLSEEVLPQILIKDLEKNEVLNKINYKKILFDSDLNIYKIEKGTPVPVNNVNFKAIVIKKK